MGYIYVYANITPPIMKDRLSSTDSSDVRKALINEMMWRAEEIGKLDTCNKKRLITNLENFRKKIGF